MTNDSVYCKFRLVLLTAMLAAGLCLSAQTRVTVHYDEDSGLSSPLVGGGVQDRDGLMWFATWNGLNCYDGYSFHRVSIVPGDSASIGTNLIRDILLTSDGDILCHTDSDVYIFDLSSFSFRDVPPQQHDSLMSLVGRSWHGITDRQGILWTADRSGLYKSYVPLHPAEILTGSEGIHPRSFLLAHDSVLWVGSRTDWSLRRYRDDSVPLNLIDLPTAPYCIFQTLRGDVWVGGKPAAMCRIIADSVVGENISDVAVYDIREDAYGRLWVATFGDGVKCCPDPEAERPVLSPSLGGRKVRKLLLTPAGNIVAATTEGLLAGRIEQNWADTRLRLISRDGCDAGSLSSNTIISLAQDSRGDIYIATESSGVDVISEKALFDDKPLFRHLDIPSAAISIAITVMDDSTVVIVGHDHVTLYNLLSGGSVCLNRAFWGESCHFSETTPLRLPDGAWLFGAEEGAFVVTPEEIAALDYVPNIVFTTLSVGGGPARFGVVPHDSLTLPAGSRNVSVGYAALDYVDNSGILYRTRFDGSAWSGAGPDRSLTLFNLSPGCHLLEVESTDRFGRWTGNVRSLSLYVTPFWYETWWARTLAAMLCVSLVAAVVLTWLYIRRINRQRRELLEKYMDAIASRHVAVAAPDSGDTVEGIPAVVSRHRPEDVAFLGRVRRYIEDNISNPDAGVDEMAAAAAVSRSTLNRRLRSLLGVSSSRLLMEARMQHAVKLIETAEVLDIAEIAEGCGYTDAHYFSRVFRNKFGVLPADYGKDSSAL